MIRAITIRRIARFGGVCLLLSMAVVVVVSKARAAPRHIVVVAIEPKGGATVDKEPFPTEAMPAGPGYVLNQPDRAARWEISAYVRSASPPAPTASTLASPTSTPTSVSPDAATP
jgi:hypothetical protein